MSFNKFTNDVTCVLETATSIGAAYQVYLHTNKSILFAVGFWLVLVICHSIQLTKNIGDITANEDKIVERLYKLTPYWFLTNSLIMIVLSNIDY